MTSNLRFSGFDGARLFLLALFAALTWLIFGANTANAASSDGVSTVPRVPAVAEEKQVVAPVTEVAAPILDTLAPVAQVAAPVTQVAAPVAQVTAPVTEAVDTVAPVTEVVNKVLVGAEDAVEVVISPVLELPLLPSVPILDDRPIPIVPPLPTLPALPTVPEILPLLTGQEPGTDPGGVPTDLPASLTGAVPGVDPDLGGMAGTTRATGLRGFAPPGTFPDEPSSAAAATKATAVPPAGEEPPNQPAALGQVGFTSSGLARGAPQAAANVDAFRASAQFIQSGRIADDVLAMPASPSYDPGSSPD